MNTMSLIDRYLARTGASPSSSLAELHRAHVDAIPYENLDIHLGRTISLEVDDLVAKLMDARRGGYCYEMNSLFAHVLETLGFSLTRHLGRVRLGDAVNPRPATHMVLHVEDCAVDVGFGSATPLAPVPLGGEVTVGGWTWSTDRMVSPEGEDVWAMRCNGTLLYTWSDERRHPIDYVTPNHFSSTHPLSVFVLNVTVQRSREDVQRTLAGLELTERFPDGRIDQRTIDLADHGPVLSELFGLDLPEPVLGALRRTLSGEVLQERD